MLPDETILTRAVCTVFSAFAHVAIFGVFFITAHRSPIDIGAREPVAPQGEMEIGIAEPAPTPHGSSPGPGAHAPASHADGVAHGHATTLGVTDAPMHVIGKTPPREGDWVGTYECVGTVYALAVHIDNVRGNSLRLLGNATSPSGLHGTYAQHGARDPATGEAKFLPDGWIGPPMPNHTIVGMHGRFDGDSFVGKIDDAQCGAVALHRKAS